MRLFWLLLLLVIGPHYFVDVLADHYQNPDKARRALFYIAGGFQGAALFGVVWALMARLPISRHVFVASSVVCAWGIAEELQTAVCRIAAGVGARVAPPMWRGICDVTAGFPFSTFLLVIPVLVLLWLVFIHKGVRNGG